MQRLKFADVGMEALPPRFLTGASHGNPSAQHQPAAPAHDRRHADAQAHRYEKGSMLITSNQAFSDWDSIFGDNMMTMAAIDRLVHHASIYQITGESYRKKQAMKMKEQNRPS